MTAPRPSGKAKQDDARRALVELSVPSEPGNERLQARKAEHLPLGVVGLYQAVSVEEGAVAFLEYYLFLLIAHPRHQPQGHPSGPQFLGVAIMML